MPCNTVAVILRTGVPYQQTMGSMKQGIHDFLCALNMSVGRMTSPTQKDDHLKYVLCCRDKPQLCTEKTITKLFYNCFLLLNQ